MSSTAGTVILPNAYYSGWLQYDATGQTYNTPGSYSLGPGSGWMAGTPNAAASLSGSCVRGPPFGNNCGSSGVFTIVYYMTVTGPFNSSVPVQMNGFPSATATAIIGSISAAQTYAAVSLSDNGNTVAYTLGTNCVGPCSYGQKWLGTLSMPMAVGDIATVEIDVGITADGAAGSNPGMATASAFADPYIYVDPTFPNASLYSIVVSPGIGNVPLGATPEPLSLALLGSGVLSVAAAYAAASSSKLRSSSAAWRQSGRISVCEHGCSRTGYRTDPTALVSFYVAFCGF